MSESPIGLPSSPWALQIGSHVGRVTYSDVDQRGLWPPLAPAQLPNANSEPSRIAGVLLLASDGAAFTQSHRGGYALRKC